MFCNQKCHREAWHRFHSVECKIIDTFYSRDVGDQIQQNPFVMLRGVVESLTQTVDRLKLLAYDLQKLPAQLTDLDVSAKEVESMEMAGFKALNEVERDENRMEYSEYLNERVEWLVRVLKKLPETDFELDLDAETTKTSEINSLQVVNFLKGHPDESQLRTHEINAINMLQAFDIFKSFVTSDDDRNFLAKYAARLMQIRSVNAWTFQYQDQPAGSGILPFCSLINHSCDPNVQAVGIGNKFACVVITPILKGEQIFINYK